MCTPYPHRTLSVAAECALLNCTLAPHLVLYPDFFNPFECTRTACRFSSVYSASYRGCRSEPLARTVVADVHSNAAAAAPATVVRSYEFNRKLLFKLLVMANSQLAELASAHTLPSLCATVSLSPCFGYERRWWKRLICVAECTWRIGWVISTRMWSAACTFRTSSHKRALFLCRETGQACAAHSRLHARKRTRDDARNAHDPHAAPCRSTQLCARPCLCLRALLAPSSSLPQVQARGPNLHINAACAGTTAALALGCDWMRAGRCRRVVVISADCPSSDNLLPWVRTR
eukprot:1693196-Pleurochrysis_carterae.AAC.1